MTKSITDYYTSKTEFKLNYRLINHEFMINNGIARMNDS